VRLMAVSLSPFVLLILIALWKILHNGAHFESMGFSPTRDLGTALSVTLWNYMGWDNASTIAQEVEDPQRNYPRAMLVSALVVMLVYMLPLLAVWAFGIPSARFSTGAWADAAGLIAGSWLAFAVVIAGSLDGLGTFSALTLTLTRLPYALAEDGLLPAALRRVTSRGVPWVSVVLCAICWALALNLTFERLISIDLVLYGASLLLEFIALAVLRVREPDLPRPFRVPGGLAAAIGCGVGPAALIGFALYAARDERVGPMPALLFASIVAAAGPLVWLVSRGLSRVRGDGD